MGAWLARLMVAGVALAVAPAALADNPTFGDLLAHAEAQAAAGHRWAPPGDNMTETVSVMMEIISTATPEQVAELSALLEADASRHPASPAAGTPPRAEAILMPTPQATGPAVTSEPDRPVPQSVVPAVSREPDRPVSAPVVPTVSSEPDHPVSPPVVTTVPNRPASPGGVPATTTEQDRPVSPPTAPAVTTGPDRPAPPPAVTAEPNRGARPAVSVPTMEPARPVLQTLAPTTVIELARPVAKPAAAKLARPDPRAAELFARGLEAERLGDVSGARRFYTIAVQQGSAAAARNLGRLYDPIYIERTAMGGIDPDLALARHWYERAVAMGDVEAAPLLEALALR